MSHYIMNIFIPVKKTYNFYLLEEMNLNIKHPVSDFYYKINDLSINLLISLKWAEWGFFFFKSLSLELKKLDKNDFDLTKIINKSVQINISDIKEFDHVILYDNIIFKNDDDYKNFYNSKIFNENTKIHLKLKINLREYLILTNLLKPVLLEI